jgi:SAM-dependent MidA family methyltransferase
MSVNEQRLRESNPDLVEALRAEIDAAGAITFARFMEIALYHPQHGYYSTERPGPGRAGDFITAPEAHPIFGHLIAEQVADLDETLGHPPRFTIREYGAGRGALALPLLDRLRSHHPERYERTRYEPVEHNAARLADLTDTLESANHGARLATKAGEDEHVTGCVVANEFLDALPVHRVVRQGAELQEIYVVWRDGWFAEQPGPLSTPEIAAHLERSGLSPAPGDRIEVNLGIERWLRTVSAALERGYVLILDYGYPAGTLYAGHRRHGTLKAYYRHSASEELYRAVGRQDLTAHVNFTELEVRAQSLGLTVLGSATQDEFLAALGLGDLLLEMQRRPGMSAEEYLAARAAAVRLIDPGAMGRFRALILGRDVPLDTVPKGLQPVIG